METVQNNLSPLFSPFPNSTKVQRSDPRRRRITVSRRCRLPQLKTVVQNFKKFNCFTSITNAAEPGGKLFIVMEVDPPQAQMRSLATEGDGKVPTPVPQSEPPASPGSPPAQPLCRLSPSHTQTRGSKWLRFSQLIYFLFLPNEVSGQFLLTWLPSPQRWGGKGGLVGVPRPAKLQPCRLGEVGAAARRALSSQTIVICINHIARQCKGSKYLSACRDGPLWITCYRSERL